MRMLCIIGLLLALPAEAQLDLHAHLSMKPGMGPLLRGSFNEAPRARSWDSHFETRASATSLDPFHAPKLIVISLYGHPYFSNLPHLDGRKNVALALEAEYLELKAFVSRHAENYAIAKNPNEAQAFLEAKKNVLVLSIEGAYGSLDTDDGINLWIDQREVSIVTPFHLTEDDLGGIALMPHFYAFFNSPLSWLQSLMISGGACFKDFCKSPMGVKPEGDRLIQTLLKKKVWIDLAHANEMEIAEILPQLETRHLPLLVTHTQVRDVFPAERALGQKEIRYLQKNGGMIGIIPTEDMMIHPPNFPITTPCRTGVSYFKELFQATQTSLGDNHIALGSDSNAPLKGLAPNCKRESGKTTGNLEENGYYTYSQWNELSDYVAPDMNWNTRIVDEFIKTWKQIR